MANRIVRSRIPSGRSKRNTTWAVCSSPTGFSTCDAATKCIAVLVPSTTLLDLIPFTIVRTRGIVTIQSDQSVATETQTGAFGMGIMNDVAGSLGVTALPGPAANCGWPGWFVHQFFNQSFLQTANGVLLNGVSYEIDSKAMRKVEAEQDIAFMVENFGASHGLQFAVSFRMLLKAG